MQNVPSFNIPTDGPRIHLSIPATQTMVAGGSYTYNQAGITYNQVGVQYGGLANMNQDTLPAFVRVVNPLPNMSIVQ